MAEVNGAAFLGILKYVKVERGEDFITKILADVGDETKKIFLSRIITVAWYPYAGFVEFLLLLDSKMGRGDLSFCAKLGKVAAQKDLETVYKAYKNDPDPSRLIKDCNLLFKSYYRDAGRMEAVSCEPDHTVMRIIGFDDMAPCHCRLLGGWLTGVITGIGASMGDDVKETRCVNRGDEYHEFSCKWRV